MSGRTRRRFGNCLEKWGFTKNPFEEYTPDEVWAGSTDTRGYLEYLLDNARESKAVLCYLIRGEYGSGKTFHMLKLQSFVDKELNGLGVYFRFPSKVASRGFVDILQALIEAVGPEVVTEVGQLLKSSKHVETREGFIGALEEIGLDVDLGSALANIVFDENLALSWSWITGRSTEWQTRSLGFRNSPKDETVAINVIAGLINYLSTKYSIICIFIDELENLRGSSREARSVREGLRTLYDELVYKKEKRKAAVAIFLSASFSVWWELEESLESALRDRLSEQIILPHLSKAEVKEFVQELFRFARDGKNKTVTPPFENQAAFDRFATMLSEERGREKSRELGTTGTPRRIVKLGNQLLQRCCSTGSETITAGLVEKYLRPSEA